MEDLETIFIPQKDFVAYVKSRPRELVGINGHQRWIVTEEDGTRHIVRPAPEDS